jgi:3-methyladenine DNA glycosylase AlkD
MHQASEEIRRRLMSRGSAEGVEKTRRYFRESVATYGCSSSDVKAVAEELAPTLKRDLGQTLIVVGELIEAGVLEEQWVATALLAKVKRQLTAEHVDRVDDWVNSLTNWASVDTFCTQIVNALVERNPETVGRLRGWAASPSRWRRRAAAVSLVPTARRGMMLAEVFGLADLLMEDRDDMVQKGVGWLLKEASKRHQGEVREYLLAWRDRAPALVLRYASEKLPPGQRVLKTRA